MRSNQRGPKERQRIYPLLGDRKACYSIHGLARSNQRIPKELQRIYPLLGGVEACGSGQFRLAAPDVTLVERLIRPIGCERWPWLGAGKSDLIEVG